MRIVYIYRPDEKNYILSKEQLNDFKIIDKETVFSKLDLINDFEKRVFLMKKYQISYEFATQLLQSMRGVFEPTSNKKIEDIFLKKQLLLQQFYEIDETFLYILKNSEIHISSSYELDKELLNLLKHYKLKYAIDELEPQLMDEKDIHYYEDDLLEAIDIFNRCCNNLSKNSDSKICIVCPSSSLDIIRLVNDFFKLPINGLKRHTLKYEPISEYLIALIKEKKPLDEETIKELNVSITTKQSIVTLFNKIIESSLPIEISINILNIELDKIVIDNLEGALIDVKTSIPYFMAYDYIYVLNCAKDIVKLNKENSFLTNEEKEMVGKNNSSILNLMEIALFKQRIRYANVYLSMPTSYILAKEVPELNYYIEHSSARLNKISNDITSHRYNKQIDELYLSKLQETFKTYLYKSPLYDTFFNNYNNKNYLMYSNKNYGDTSKFEMPNNFSFSSLDEYSKCRYRYFLNRVLKIKEESSFNILLGNIIHLYLEKNLIQETVSIEEILKQFNLNKKEIIFAKKYLKNIEAIIPFFQSLMSELKLLKSEQELSVDIVIDSNINGKLDLVLMDENYYMIIDFKTYIPKISLEAMSKGYNLQLMIYSLLLKEKYPNKQLMGVYYAPISGKVEQDNKLIGLTISSQDVIDHFYDKRKEFVKVKKEDKDSVSAAQFFDLQNVAVEQIKNTIKLINEKHVEINPLNVKFKDCEIDSCENCIYLDICNRQYSDITMIKGSNDDEDLGEQTNEMV